MSAPKEIEMSTEEIDEFLGRHETGVLTLARDGSPYSIPISYGYDTTDRIFYLRLVSTPESEKREFLESAPETRIVVYHEEDQSTYRSVIAKGTLTQIQPDTLSVSQIEQYGDAQRPLFEIWGEDKEELDIQLFRCSPEQLSGRRTEVDRDNW